MSSNQSTVEQDPRWSAVLNRDPRADGQFVYAVKTTGIYCRPSSLARLPHPKNVVFFDTEEQARAAGFRPSKRAAADQSLVAAQHAALVAAACRQIEAADSPPPLAELASAATRRADCKTLSAMVLGWDPCTCPLGSLGVVAGRGESKKWITHMAP